MVSLRDRPGNREAKSGAQQRRFDLGQKGRALALLVRTQLKEGLMAMYQIILRLARNPGFPDGDESQGYVFIAPLNASDKLDAAEWRQNRAAYTVVRFKPGTDRDADGRLTHNGANWFFHYDEVDEGE